MGRPIKWSFQPDKRHEAIAKDACGGYEKLKADIAEKEKMLAEIKQEQAAAISDLERGIKEEMYTECKREYDKQGRGKSPAGDRQAPDGSGGQPGRPRSPRQ